MRVFRNIQFREGLNCSLSEFKKDFATHLIGLSDKEVKQAHKTATNGNIKRSKKKGVKAEQSI